MAAVNVRYTCYNKGKGPPHAASSLEGSFYATADLALGQDLRAIVSETCASELQKLCAWAPAAAERSASAVLRVCECDTRRSSE